IVAHSHGKMLFTQASRTLVLQPIANFTQLSEKGTGLIGILKKGRNSHETVQTQPRKPADFGRQLANQVRRSPELRGFLAEVHLNQDRERFSGLYACLAQLRAELYAIHGVDYMEELHGEKSIDVLQVANEMPLEIGPARK